MEAGTPRLVEIGQGTSRVLPLHSGRNTVGRGPSRDVSLDHASISRLHAVIELGDRAVLNDEESRNGTFVDGIRVKAPIALRSGQTIRFGQISFRFVDDSPATDFGGRPDVARSVESVDSSSSADKTILEAAIASFVHDEDRERHRHDLLRALAAVFAIPRSTAELRAVILDQVPRLVAADRALLIEFDADRQVSVQGTRGASVSYSQHVVDWVVSKREATLFRNAQRDERLATAMSIAEGAVQCVLAAPLVADDEVLGVLYVDNTLDGDALGEADVDALILVASQAALALRNASLQKLRHTYERYFPPTTTQQLLADLAFGETPVTLQVTALFADLSDYTGLCERLEPAALVDLLNGFFPPMAKIVFDRGGMLEKYIGDALLAAWGAPFPSDNDAARALDAARAMQAEARRLGLDVHIGVHTGPVALTRLGSEDYLQLALIGETTTIAARVCGQAEGGQIVMTEATRASAGESEVEPLGPRALKGWSQPLELYRLNEA